VRVESSHLKELMLEGYTVSVKSNGKISIGKRTANDKVESVGTFYPDELPKKFPFLTAKKKDDD
jgi:hypothetical protein